MGCTRSSVKVWLIGIPEEQLLGSYYPLTVRLGVEQLLGVPKLTLGTGMAQATPIVRCLEEWSVIDLVVVLCFDSTASNTGPYSGACSILEQKLGQDLLFLDCCYHIMELVFGAAFKVKSGGSTGPEIFPYKQFCEHWQLIDCKNFYPASTDESVELLVTSS